MTTKIHHMTIKRAAKMGFVIEKREKLYLIRAIDGGEHVLAMDENINEALRKARDEPMLPPSEGSVVKRKYKQRYGKTACNGDEMAIAVNAYIRTEDGTDEDALRELAISNGLDYGRWSHLNIGQRSMSVRNCLRGMLRRGERAVIVGSMTFEPQDVPSEDRVAA